MSNSNEPQPIESARRSEATLYPGLLLWSFPIWWPFLYAALLYLVSLLGLRLYLYIPGFVFTIGYLLGFVLAYMLSLVLIKTTARTHLYTAVIWFVAFCAIYVMGFNDTVMAGTFSMAAGCPRDKVHTYGKAY